MARTTTAPPAKRKASAPVSVPVAGNADDREYHALLAAFRANALERIGAGPVFTTDAAGLFALYLESFPLTTRQHHTCHACRRFLETYGGLVSISEAGALEPVFWPAAAAWAEDYATPIANLRRRVSTAKVTGVFLSKDVTWGLPATGPWVHFAVTLPAALPRRSSVLTPGQEMAERVEDFGQVMRALDEWTVEVMQAGVRLLESDALYRSEKLLGAATWLRDLAVARRDHKRVARNILWRAIGTAPAGFCHPRSGMLGTLLDDLASGASFTDVSERFAAKMHPLRYQRPQAAPTAGAIQQAEKLVETLGLAPSLVRRFARVDDIAEWLWRPRTPKDERPSGGVFGHLKAKGAAPNVDVTVPETAMSWTVFARAVLPDASALMAFAPALTGYVTLVTAEHADAPPILQWDRAEVRNPVSWYVWQSGSTAAQYGLSVGWVPVEGCCLMPHQWGGQTLGHQAGGILVMLEGAKETRNAGSALFPECLKADLHGVRSVIEAHSRSKDILDHGDHAGGTGLCISGRKADVRLKVTRDGVTSVYRIDRME